METNSAWLTLCCTNESERATLWPELREDIKSMFSFFKGMKCHPACLPLDGRAMIVFLDGTTEMPPSSEFVPVLHEKPLVLGIDPEPVSVYRPFQLDEITTSKAWRMRIMRYVRVHTDDTNWVLTHALSTEPKYTKVPIQKKKSGFISELNKAGEAGVVTHGTSTEPTVVLFVCEVLDDRDERVDVEKWVKEECFTF